MVSLMHATRERLARIDMREVIAFSLLGGVLALTIAVVGIDLVGELTQNISLMLNLKHDQPVQLLLDSLSALVALPNVSTTSTGYAPLRDDQVMEYRMYLGPNYMDEQGMFPKYIDALTRRRYRVLEGMTKSLWNQTHDIRSSMGSIGHGIDWWDLVSSPMDVQGTIRFTGTPTDMKLLSMNYSALKDRFQLDPDTGVMNLDAINSLVPQSSIPKRQQLTAIMYKEYSTDPQQLPSFNLRIASNEWLARVGARDFAGDTAVPNATCSLRQKPTYVWFDYGYWRPLDFFPGDNYKTRYSNISYGDWVIECDTPSITFQAKNIRWYAGLRNRHSTIFHQLGVQVESSRKIIFTQQMLLNASAPTSTHEIPIRSLVSMPNNGPLTPLPSTLYVVETDTLASTVRSVWLVIALILLLHVRSSLVGFRTLLHFLLESPLGIVINLTCAIVTMSTGVERAMILADAPVGTSFKRIAYMAVALRPFTIPSMLLTKAVISLFYGTKHVTPYVSIRESTVLLFVQILVINLTSSTVVTAGLHAGTTVDDVNSFVWHFHGTTVAITGGFIYAQLLLRHELRALCVTRSQARIIGTAIDAETPEPSKDVYGTKPAKRHKHKPADAPSDHQLATSSSLPAYDEYVGSRFFAFGFLSLVNVNGRRCRVLDGAPLWMEAIFNFNWNGPDRYNRMLRTGRVVFVSCVGQFVTTDVVLDAKQSKDTGAVYLG